MIFSVLAFIAVITSICIKDRKKSLCVQSLSCIFEGLYGFWISAFTGAVLGIVNFIRSFLFVKKDKFNKETYFFILILFEILVVANCIVTYEGIISLLPTIGSIIRTYCLWQSNMKYVRMSGMATGITYGTYYIYHRGWFMVLGYLAILIVGIITVYKNDIKTKKEKHIKRDKEHQLDDTYMKVDINMKKTLLFSNVIGDICTNHNTDLKFNEFMEEYLLNNIKDNNKLVFINAPGLGGEENYLKNIVKCFENIGIRFCEIFDLEIDSNNKELETFIKDENKVVYFLMGGNPLTQMEIINKFNLENRIKEHKGLVIGFCAGAINLSKYSIITTDEDFDKCHSYKGIERISLIIEPHYNTSDDHNRNKELLDFTKQYNQEIFAIPDESIIVVEDEKISEYGKIYHIDNKL